MSGTMVVGDVHAVWGALNTLINKKRPRTILQVGDFGYWPRMAAAETQRRTYGRECPEKPKQPKAGGARIYFCPGNHEDWDSLDRAESNELWPEVFYMAKGSTHTLDDGRVVLFMGGARSIDQEWRTLGLDWFQQEEINRRDMEALEANLPERVDIVISHTCPVEFPLNLRSMLGQAQQQNDWSQTALSRVLQILHPALWYFGHFHAPRTGYTAGCRWTCLDMAGGNSGRWWTWLP
jgi:hypothetical protein